MAGMGRLATDPAQTIASAWARASRAAFGGLEDGGLDDINATRAELAEYQAAFDDLREATALLENENTVLKNRLGMVEKRAMLSLALCKVQKRDPFSAYYDSIVINRGTNDGIKKGCHVMSETGLAGVVSEASFSTSLVTLITSRDFSMPCFVRARNVYGLLIGNGVASGQKISMLQPVPKIVVNSLDGILFDKVAEGDKVTVSATGDMAGPGIVVGTVSKLDTSVAGAPVLEIEPAASLNQLKYLYVVVGISSRDGGK